MSSDAHVPTGLSSTITLNDGVVMPMFGLGTYLLSTGAGGGAETITSFAIQKGYRLIDTATFYGCDLLTYACVVGPHKMQLTYGLLESWARV